MPIWTEIPITFPTDGETVWVRVFFGQTPFQATFRLDTRTFTSSDGLVLPWNYVRRWRPL